MKLTKPFDLSAILSPLHLCPLAQIPKRILLHDPRAVWIQIAGRLDSRLAHRAAGSPERRAAEWVRGNAPSFRAKCAAFFDAASNDIEALERRGVNPNVIGAAMVHYAWEWRAADRSVPAEALARGPRRSVWKRLREGAAALEECRVLARESDLLDHDAARVAALQASEEPDAIIAFDVRDFDPLVLERAHNPGQAQLEACVVETARSVLHCLDELQRATERLAKRRAHGRPPEERVNTLIVLLACVFQAQTRQPRFARIARLLDAAALPGVPPGYFGEYSGEADLGWDRVRHRFYELKDCAVAREIAAAVQQALVETERLPKL